MDELKTALREAVYEKNELLVTGLMAHAGLTGLGPDIEPWFRELIESAPHEVHEFWMGECNCDGHLN